MVSIVLASTTSTGAVGGIVAKARKDVGNMRAVAYRQPGGWRWRSVQMFGIVKPDVVVIDGAAMLMPHRFTLIPSFPVTALAPASNTLWMPCANLAVCHPHLDRAELARVLMHQWPGSGRVFLRPFDSRRTAADNAAAVVDDGLDGLEQARFSDTDSQRTARWDAELQSWLFRLRRGLQPLGMSLRARPNSNVRYANEEDRFTAGKGWMGDEIEPMPVLV
jgi:hypothetical protein